MRDLTRDMALTRPVIDALQACGVDPAALLARISLSEDGRLDGEHQAVFWQAAGELCGEEHVGLFLSRHLPSIQLQWLQALFFSGPTFGAGLRHALRYMRLLCESAEAQLECDTARARLRITLPANMPRHWSEMLVGVLVRLFASLSDGSFSLHEVHFAHAEGASDEYYQAAYGCPVYLGAEACVLMFDASVLARPLRHVATPELRMHEKLLRRRLMEAERQQLVRQVRELIAELLADGGVTLEQVATRLDMPVRRLRERLAMTGVRFNDLASDYRCRLAKELLLNTDERIEVIVERTGFSEPSTFYRAFKRWVGQTPVEFRKNGRKLADVGDFR
ncbi:AraC family transcriptional regulator [Pseudomonas sp. NCCP-436]|uniref:AraC family transcriptional regulator n=1 Tax=Pseudomonas sp. NCCP-436 TaxID=2842481 RepID=UPI001C807BB8|nr:AraC family transcriptional regulator [Pseudomonas sp. NCCP-436]